MIKKLTFIAATISMLSTGASAQYARCGADEANKKLKSSDPNFAKSVAAFDLSWSKKMIGSSSAYLTFTPAGYVYEVPVVIHVVHTGGTVGSNYNPTDGRLDSMINYVNQTFAATWPSYPDSSSGGVRIPLKFVLAKRTPTCGSTTGILRVNGSSVTGYTTYGAGSSSGPTDAQIMALSRYPYTDYYNIYIVNKIDGVDGYPPFSGSFTAAYAYFAGATGNIDGTICLASQAKAGNTTLVHELGHAFNLYHTFEGDAGGTTCPPNVNCNTDGDLICDTEPHKRSAIYASWCPPSDANPCTGGASYNNVQHNIMDYTNCPPNRFTAGQRTRMMDALLNMRAGLTTSAGLIASPVTPVVSATCVPGIANPGNFFQAGPLQVKFVDFNMISSSYYGDGNKEYIDHACTQQATVYAGSSHTITITTRTNPQKVRVYIDFNNDGDFIDAGESVYAHDGTTASETHTGTISIPSSGISTCTVLRMRVIADLTSGTVTPCGTLEYGQAEDFGVYIKPVASSTGSVSVALTAGTNPSCAGSSVTYTATASAPGTPTYKWFINGVSTGVTTTSYTSSTLNNGDAITCRIYFNTGCGVDSVTSSAIVQTVSSSVPATAKIKVVAGTMPTCIGQKLTFGLTLTNAGTAPTYDWKVNGTSTGVTTDTFSTSTLSAGDKVHCYVVPNSPCSTTPINSDTMTIVFGTITPGITKALTAGTNPSCDSTSLTFTATPTNGGTTPIYQWFVNSVPVPGATADTYTDSYLKDKDTVRCKMISTASCVAPGNDTVWTAPYVVYRNPILNPKLDVNITYGSNPGCADSLLEFTATVSGSGSAPVVSWYINGTLMAYGSVFGSTGFADGDQMVCKLEVTPGICSPIDSIVLPAVTINRVPVPTPPIISLIGTLLVSSTTTNIQWYGPSGLIPGATGATYHPTVKGVYYAVTTSPGCNSAPSNKLNVALLSISPANMSELKIYPNPTTGLITLDWGAISAEGTVDVYSVTGQRMIHSEVGGATQKVLDLSEFVNGNYFIVIHDNNGKTGTASITVTH